MPSPNRSAEPQSPSSVPAWHRRFVRGGRGAAPSRGVGGVLATTLVVIVAVVVVGGLLFAGVIPMPPSSRGGGGSQPTYKVTFAESGLPNGSTWSVTLAGSTTSSTNPTIAFDKSNGTFAFQVSTPAGYTAAPALGNVTVNGSALGEAIAMEVLPPAYPVSFSETGLPLDAGWFVSAFETGAEFPVQVFETGSTIEFTLPNGTYNFYVESLTSNYTAEPGYGTVNVSGHAVERAVVFAPPSGYAVTFTESGLSAGTSWTIQLNSSSETSAAPTITFVVPNGTYVFFVTATNYTASPEFGSVKVAGGPMTQPILFSRAPIRYVVTFTETGLASGATWSATLDSRALGINETIGSSGPGAIKFDRIENGTYSFSVNASGYPAVPSSGTIVVDGRDVTQAIAFGPPPRPGLGVTFVEAGLAIGTEWVAFLSNLSNARIGTDSTSVAIPAPNGTYGWSAYALGYEGSPTTGIVTVNGTFVTVHITFSGLVRGTYLVLFAPYPFTSGIPGSASWTITLGGETLEIAGSVPVVFVEPNGTFSWLISAPVGYFAYGAAGTLEIEGGLSQFAGEESVGAAILFSFLSIPAGALHAPCILSSTAPAVPSSSSSSFELAPSGRVGVPGPMMERTLDRAWTAVLGSSRSPIVDPTSGVA